MFMDHIDAYMYIYVRVREIHSKLLIKDGENVSIKPLEALIHQR